MFVAFVALGDPLPDPPDPPPRPGILSFTADAAPFSTPLTGLSPFATALPPSRAALTDGLPFAAPSSRSVQSLTRSPTAPTALLPSVEKRSCPAALSRSCPVDLVATADHLPPREPDVVRDREDFFA